jgi:hypothetical protein
MRAIMPHGGNEPLLAGYIFSWLEHINPRTGPLDDICQAEPPIRKTPIVLVREWLRRELRLE